jgi:predicted AAA+ superfamily ATPase
LYRKQLDDLYSWYHKKNRKPLIIRGARQVGKSTLVREFARINKLTLIEINLEKHLELTDTFKKNKPEVILDAVSDILDKKINWNDTKEKYLFFIDEVQAIPAAIACLRYFYEDYPALPIVSAGSLLEFTLNDHSYSMPVGRVEFLHMGPMTFAEFLRAKKQDYLLDKMSSITKLEQISEVLHQKCLAQLKEYLFVGGMPEAIKIAIEEGLDEVPAIHEQILETYQSDFVKYAKKSHLLKIQKVFRYLYLNPCKKLKYSNISSEDNSRELKFNLELLLKAKIATPVYHTKCSGLPLEVSKDESIFKNLLLDVGLMNHVQKLTWQSLKNFSETELLTDGQIAEQFIGQHLLAGFPSYQDPSLYYWLREGKSANAELDYLIEKPPYLVAIEVKAGAAGKIRSLHQWMKDISYKKKKCVRFNLSKGFEEEVEYQFEESKLKYQLLTLPLYLIQNLDQFL